MSGPFGRFLPLLRRWCTDNRATALTETAILFPVMMSLLMGVYDIGLGISINHKTITASQVIGDLVTRNIQMQAAMIEDIVEAGQLSLEPYPVLTMGYDIASIEFESDGDPCVLWRVTENMDPNQVAVESTEGLGGPGEGILAVTVAYRYTPYFSNFVVDTIDMQEVAFLRGRRSPTVPCPDCPSAAACDG